MPTNEELVKRLKEKIAAGRAVIVVGAGVSVGATIDSAGKPNPVANTARAHYEEALTLYRRIQEPYSIGWTHQRLTLVASEPATHQEAAREAWRSIGREDLIANWLDNETPDTT
jgi:hypothetical protein